MTSGEMAMEKEGKVAAMHGIELHISHLLLLPMDDRVHGILASPSSSKRLGKEEINKGRFDFSNFKNGRKSPHTHTPKIRQHAGPRPRAEGLAVAPRNVRENQVLTSASSLRLLEVEEILPSERRLLEPGGGLG